MKIFSNFNTELKQEAYQDAIDKFGKENVLILRKSGLYLLVKVVFPFIFWTLVLIFLQFPIYFALHDLGTIKYYLTGFMFLLYLLISYPSLKHLIDYHMDFSLFTPNYLTRYNQTWLFKRDIKTSNVKNIKTITVKKNTFLYNIFNNGDLVFLSEGDRGDQGEIELHFIKCPEDKRKEIARLVKLHRFI